MDRDLLLGVVGVLLFFALLLGALMWKASSDNQVEMEAIKAGLHQELSPTGQKLWTK